MLYLPLRQYLLRPSFVTVSVSFSPHVEIRTLASLETVCRTNDKARLPIWCYLPQSVYSVATLELTHSASNVKLIFAYGTANT